MLPHTGTVYSELCNEAFKGQVNFLFNHVKVKQINLCGLTWGRPLAVLSIEAAIFGRECTRESLQNVTCLYGEPRFEGFVNKARKVVNHVTSNHDEYYGNTV